MSQLLQGPAVGVHLLVNVYDVSEVSLLEYLTRGRPLLDQIVQIMQLHVMSQTGHQFQPMGYTYAYVLSESHFTIHTYPEHRSCYIDLFCCHPEFNPVQAVHLIKRMFHTENVRYQIVPR